MKKLSVIQIIAGILLMASWFVYINLVQPGYHTLEILDISGNIIAGGYSSASYPANSYFIVWITGFPIIGILITGCGISRLIKNIRGLGTRKLDIAQIVFGILALAVMILFVTQIEPPWENNTLFPGLDGFPGAVEIRHNSGWLVLMNVWKIVSFALGPVVAATGVWQMVKTRKTIQ